MINGISPVDISEVEHQRLLENARWTIKKFLSVPQKEARSMDADSILELVKGVYEKEA